jgi:1-acyl-sn-glycerol-3-phosphate acyltransferase
MIESEGTVMAGKRVMVWYHDLWRAVVRTLLLFVGRLTVKGKENLPTEGAYIAATNHLSKIDPAVIIVTLPSRAIRVFAASKWRKHLIFGPILNLSGAIWVRRGEVDRTALREAIDALQAGQILGMAPEGTRSRIRKLQKAREGAAYIGSQAGVPIVPIGVINSDSFLENVKRLRRTDLEVNIGRPFYLPDVGHRPRGKELEAYTELIMGHIAALLPERYHGYYSDSPVLAALQVGDDPWPAAWRASGMPGVPVGNMRPAR